jgi:hypothetical protein
MEQVPFDGETGSTPGPSSSFETLDASPLETGRPAHGHPRLAGRVARALPGAFAGAFLVGAIAFGASAVRPALTDTSSNQAAGGTQAGTGGAVAGNGSSTTFGASHGSTQSGPDDRGDGSPDGTTDGTGTGDGPGTERTDGTGTEPTAKPDPIVKPEPIVKPNLESMRLVLTVTDGGAVKVDWTRCSADGAVAYKVVRTTDGRIGWPFGGADHLIAAIKDLGLTAVVDNDAPAVQSLVYRVFCVGGHDGAWTILDSTPGRAIHVPGNEPTPRPEPTPIPQTMSVTLSSSETGGVSIDWSQCNSDGFYAYKVVRSPDEATSWPLGANDMLVTWIKERSVTDFVDTSVEPGGHYFYRVFCVRATGDGYKVLNSTHVKAFTVSAN